MRSIEVVPSVTNWPFTSGWNKLAKKNKMTWLNSMELLMWHVVEVDRLHVKRNGITFPVLTFPLVFNCRFTIHRDTWTVPHQFAERAFQLQSFLSF